MSEGRTNSASKGAEVRAVSPELTGLHPNHFVFTSRTQCQEAFDKVNKVQLWNTVGELHHLYMPLVVVLLSNEEPIPLAQHEAGFLFWRALDILVSALHVVRQRAYLEGMALMRMALECGCTALHISQCPTAFDRYLNNSYESSRGSISYAKGRVARIGEIWGALSKGAVHINRLAHGRLVREPNGEMTQSFALGAREGTPVADQALLDAISMTACIIRALFETVFLDEAQHIAGSKYSLYSPDADAKIRSYYDSFISSGGKLASGSGFGK